MSEISHYQHMVSTGKITRRDFMEKAAALGLTATAASTLLSSGAAAQSPNKGGTLKQGMLGASTVDDLAPGKQVDRMIVNVNYQLRNNLVEIASDGQAVPELAESWDVEPGARKWVFNLRQGVEFHNGKTMDAEDVVFSLNQHRGEASESGGKGLADGIADIRADGKNQVIVELTSGNADLPYLLADRHFKVIQRDENPSNGVGTGGYILESWEPGVRAITRKNPNYWKEGRAHVDAIETLAINDTAARSSALQTGAIHLMNAPDPKTLGLMKRNKNLQILRSAGGRHFTFAMRTDMAPFDNNHVRLALKYAIDREQLVKTILRGYGRVGNDHPVPETDPYHAKDLPQHSYDPDKAKFHLKQAGLDSLSIPFHTSDAAFVGAVDSGVLLRESAAAAGINVDIVREPADGFWSDVWMKKPFCPVYWDGRPTGEMMMSTVFQSDASWNDTFWKREDFDKLLLSVRAELDTSKRAEIYYELQRMISEEGGALTPMFADFVDIATADVMGFEASPENEMSGHRSGERVWLAS
ncbi:ABC transporter substrate-binding protein [Kiloniella laminariae]|uniref:ABC transporter substrate-binding protein n=1 Tax=Kiloniella laminariae TaxID=454162 RepID=UPI0003A1CC75|nr:ABC transporter substrate-binding protein [Kiloniella laminariae]